MLMERDPKPLVNVLFWISAVALVATCCICGGMIKGWW